MVQLIRKAGTLMVLTVLLISTMSSFFTGFTRAMNDEHNLSGLIWRADGSTPPSMTGFAVWVEFLPGSGSFTRYPSTGWYQTSDVVNSQLWYSMVLPDEDFNVKWGDTAIYSVEVDASVWGEFSGNTTSNGTGSPGDPFPSPYDPSNPANMFNTINYTAGGGYMNEQQWDVRTLAPKDLVPTNVTVDGMDPSSYPSGIPLGGGTTVTVYFNVTSLGLVGTGVTFSASAWNASASGLPFDINSPIAEFLSLGPLNGWGNATPPGFDSGVLSFKWTVPAMPGDYYINITVDSGYVIDELSETNNTVILRFMVGPDLIPVDVAVDGVTYPDWPQLSPIILPAPNQWIHISINISNVGATSSGPIPFNVAFYNVSVIDHTPIDSPFADSGSVHSNLAVGAVSFGLEGYWYAPSPGEFRINLTVDFGKTIGELSEANNTYVLRVLVGPDVIPDNVNVLGQPLLTSPSLLVPVGLGQLIPITMNATNVGFSPTGVGIWVGFYNSTISGVMLNAPFYNQSIAELNGSTEAGNSQALPTGFWLSPTVAGIYYVTLYVDISNQSFEFNESNNMFVISFIAGPDLTYTGVTVNGAKANLTDPTEVWYAGSGDTVSIGVNASNVGASPTGLAFWVSFTNCTASGTLLGPPFKTFLWVPSLNPGQSSTPQIATWIVPNFVGHLYVSITIDYLNNISEPVETNNTYIVHFVVEPELIISMVLVNGDLPENPHNVSSGSIVTFSVKVKNIGYSPTGLPGETFDVTLYNVTGPNGTLIPGTEIFQVQATLNPTEESTFLIFNWLAPATELTHSWINITVDFSNDVFESNEDNNNITIHLYVPAGPVTAIQADPMTPIHRIQVGVLSVWYIDSTTELYFNVNGTNPPFYTWYRIIDYTTGAILKDWKNYTDEGGGNFLLTWGEGTFRIDYYSIDGLLNIEGTRIKYIIVDDTPPTTSVDFSAPGYRETSSDNWNISSQTQVTITSVDNPLGLSIIGELNASGIGVGGALISFRILRQSDSQVMWTWTQAMILTNVNGLYTTQYFTFDAAWPDGLYIIEYYAVDNLGHPESTKSTTINLDNTAPAKTIDYGNPKYRDQTGHLWNITSDSLITLGADDGTGSGVNRTEYRVYGSTFDTGWVVYDTQVTISSSWDDGIYTIEYNSTDNLGNDATDSSMFYLDNTGPTPYINAVLGQQKFPGRYEVLLSSPFTFSADDGAGSGVQTIEYTRDTETTWHTYTGGGNFTFLFPLISPDEITWNHTIYVRSMDRLGNVGPVATLDIFFEGDLTPPRPPVLKTYVVKQDPKYIIRLYWEPDTSPDSLDVDHYLIYRSTTKMGFDFKEPWINTGLDADLDAVIPLRTTWNDTTALDMDAPLEYYYTIRGVDGKGNRGYNSNIAGKVTILLEKGYNSLSLPLAPFENVTASEMLAGAQFVNPSDTVYQYNETRKQWWGRAKNMPAQMNDFTIAFGKGYMIYIEEEEVSYTFCGAAGCAIRFMEDTVGDDKNFRESLKISLENGETKLSWAPTEGASGYNIYKGSQRYGNDSINDLSLDPENPVPVTETGWNTSDIQEDEYYLLVVPVEGDGSEGSSTYGLGVRTYTFGNGYTSFAFELEPRPTQTLGTIAKNLPTTPDTLYYYKGPSKHWQGHPRGLPEIINTGYVVIGCGYFAYTHEKSTQFAVIGV